MPHTLSPRARATRIRATPIGHIGNMVLIVDCGPCGQRSMMLRDIPDQDQTLGDVLRRMRCRVCRGRVVAAWLAPGVGMAGATVGVLGRPVS
jgi:hypothetical protein